MLIRLSKRNRNFLFSILIIVSSLLLGIFHFYNFEIGYDWLGYHPGTKLLINFQSPYTIDSFGIFSPPWALIPLIPMALMPIKIGAAVHFVVTVFCLIYICYVSAATPLATAAFFFSYPVFRLLIHGQIDWLVMLGFILPPQIGLFLVLIKPQVGIGIALYWAVEAWKRNGIKEVVRIFTPVTLAFLLSFIIYGPYIIKGKIALSGDWNWSIWPFGIPIGIGLLYWAFKKGKSRLAIISGPFLSPYVGMYSWSIAFFGILNRPLVIILFSIFSWVIVYFY